MTLLSLFFFFFSSRRRHTRSLCDWSSDVCSSDLLTRLHDVEWFTTLDLCWGFNNVQLKEGDEWKAAFSTNQGLFEPLIMFFGLCNSLATFQMMMNDILHPFIDRNEAICYMDNILIHSASLADPCRITQEILWTLCS